MMKIAADKIHQQLEEMVRNRDLLALDVETLVDAQKLIRHLQERIEELDVDYENPGPLLRE
ncbi:MAG TPA: hypothetical protein VMX56_00900 [Anaerolineales bacterium]|nr:hypothetical protein [Anaerolineales bacterium]